MSRRAAAALGALVLLALPLAPPGDTHGVPPVVARPVYQHATQALGLEGFLHAAFLGNATANPLFPEITGPGACMFDYDGDGWMDLYLVSGLYLSEPEKNVRLDPRSRLYRNLEGAGFAYVGPATGTALQGMYQGCAAADYDNDGDQDLYVTGYRGNVLFRNDGGVFANATDAAGVRDRECFQELCWSSSASWLDYDRDGCLDLYVNHFAEYSIENPGPLGPNGNPGQENRLFRNRCDGTFEDRTLAANLTERLHSWSSVAADFDGDLWPDIYVSNDGDINDYYRNNGDGTFTNVANNARDRWNGMGTAVGDMNLDGRLDIVTTNGAGTYNGIYLQRPDGNYDNIGGHEPFDDAWDRVGWAAHFYDMGNDGYPDLMVVNGLTDDTVGPESEEPVLAYEGVDGTRWQRANDDVGPPLPGAYVARGAAWGDYNNDGDVDVLIAEAGENPTHFLRAYQGPGNFLTLDLVGTAPGVTRDAVHARAWVRAPGLTPQMQEKQMGSGYMGSNDPRLPFGLGTAESADVEVRWPDGSVQHFPGLRANTFVRLTQGQPEAEVVRERPLVRLHGPEAGVRAEPLTFFATLADSTLWTVSWDFGQGLQPGPRVRIHAWDDFGWMEVRAYVTDTLGRSKSQGMRVFIPDRVVATVSFDDAEVRPHEPLTGVVEVRDSVGHGVAGARLQLTVEVRAWDPVLEQVLTEAPKVRNLLGYGLRTIDGTTDRHGRLAFEVPSGLRDPLGFASAHPPGTYTVLAEGRARENPVVPGLAMAEVVLEP